MSLFGANDSSIDCRSMPSQIHALKMGGALNTITDMTACPKLTGEMI